MKKIFSIFAAMLVALTVNAKVWNIGPNECHEGHRDDGYTLYVTLDRGAGDGDTIVLADGTYQEGLTMSVNHPVVIMAAEGARPVVKMGGYIKVYKNLKCEGIKFDHSDVTSNSYCFYPFATGIDYLILEDCELTGFKSGCIMSWEAYHIDSLAINNCYFHDNEKSAVYCPSSKCDELVVSNSTFANFIGDPAPATDPWSAAILDVRNAGTVASDIKVRVDHCTFYNNRTRNYDYGDIKSYKSTDVVVSNCIFFGSDSINDRATAFYGGTIKNCLTINYGKEKAGHRTDGVTFTDTLLNRDPMFVDAANGNFMLQAGSPALTAATDGGPLGDPFWNTKALYLNPGVWNTGGAKFAIWCYGRGSHDAQWSGFMTLAPEETNIYTANIPAGYPNVIFGRINGEAATPDWSAKWNQSFDLAVPSNKNLYTITGWGEDKQPSPGEWSKYNYISTLEDGWYLVGTFGGVEKWTVDKLTAAQKFSVNPSKENEYLVTATLVAGDEFKAAYVYQDEITEIKPAGTGNNYVVDANHAGADKTIYYKVAYDEGWGGHFYIEANASTAIDNVEVDGKAVKTLENGMLIIEKNGVKYNILGSVIK